MTVGNQPRDQVDQEIDWAVMARVLELTDVFELIVDDLVDRSFAQK